MPSPDRSGQIRSEIGSQRLFGAVKVQEGEAFEIRVVPEKSSDKELIRLRPRSDWHRFPAQLAARTSYGA